MALKQYLAHQLGNPSGLIGKWFLGPLWNWRNVALNELTLAHLDLQANDRVLDVGFGGGYLLARIIPKVQAGLAVGVDISPVMVENARRQWREAIQAGKVIIECAPIEALPFPEESFTKICSVNSIFYWADAQKSIENIYRCLRAGGKMALTFTCHRDLQNKWFVPYGAKPYLAVELQDMLTQSGFSGIYRWHGHDRHREFICMTASK